MFEEDNEEAEARIESVMERYRRHLNPGLARLLQFAGFADIEETAEGCVLTTALGKRYLDFVGGVRRVYGGGIGIPP